LRHGSARFGREFYNALFASALIGCPGSRAQDPQFCSQSVLRIRNDTVKKPNRQQYYVALAVYFYFALNNN